MSETRSWPTPVVVSGATGRLLCQFGEVHEFLDWITGDTLMTHQLPCAFDAAEPVLLEQFPWMRNIAFPDFDSDDTDELERFWYAFAADLAAEHGQALEVTSLVEWERRNPIAELVDMVGEDRIIPVVVDGVR